MPSNQELADMTINLDDFFDYFFHKFNWNLFLGLVCWGAAIAFFSHKEPKLKAIFYYLGWVFMVSGVIRVWVQVEWVFLAPAIF
ncbi:MAG: hypothetical protein K6G63_01625 [Eubacterium sp.]|nr:hypothetical protein [Eubacterium sp.]